MNNLFINNAIDLPVNIINNNIDINIQNNIDINIQNNIDINIQNNIDKVNDNNIKNTNNKQDDDIEIIFKLINKICENIDNNENIIINNNENININNDENINIKNNENIIIKNDIIEEIEKGIIKEEKNEIINDDVWEDSINDEKYYINNKIARIFPLIKNFNNYSKLKIDEESFSYITVREIADMISKIISYHLLYFNLNPQKMTIIDYTAGVGGNVLSFSKYFNHVYAIEICEERANYLENNINVYGFKNITVINKSAIDFNREEMIEKNPNVIFMDPPWGGNDYKNSDTLLLKLGSKSVEELIGEIIIIYSEYYKKQVEYNTIKSLNFNNKLIVLKLPKNYDIEYFYNYIKKISVDNYTIKTYLYILNKMIIIICEMEYKNFEFIN